MVVGCRYFLQQASNYRKLSLNCNLCHSASIEFYSLVNGDEAHITN